MVGGQILFKFFLFGVLLTLCENLIKIPPLGNYRHERVKKGLAEPAGFTGQDAIMVVALFGMTGQ